jgi:hypothetical protein
MFRNSAELMITGLNSVTRTAENSSMKTGEQQQPPP